MSVIPSGPRRDSGRSQSPVSKRKTAIGSLKSAANQFADNTYLHGPKLILDARGKVRLLLWLAVLTACMCGMAVQLEELIRAMIDDDIRTTVRVKPPSGMPPLTICPRGRWTRTDGGLSDAGAAYLRGYFPMDESMGRSKWFTGVFDKIDDFHSLRYDSDAVKEVDSMLKGKYNHSMEAMATDLLLSYEDMVSKEFSTPMAMDVEHSKLVNLNGPCHVIYYDPVGEDRVNYVQHTLRLKFFNELPGPNAHYHLFIGGKDSVATAPEIAATFLIRGNHYTVMHVRVRRIIRYSGRNGKRCREYTLSDKKHCGLAASIGICKECQLVTASSTNYAEVKAERYCNAIDYEEVGQNMLEHCLVKITSLSNHAMRGIEQELCPPPCVEEVYEATKTSDSSENNITVIELKVDLAGSSTEIEEKPLITYPEFLASLGGTIGLWFGASVVAFAQTFYVCVESLRGQYA